MSSRRQGISSRWLAWGRVSSSTKFTSGTGKGLEESSGESKEGGGRGCVPPPPFLEVSISIKRVRNLSQNAGNGHFRDSNFQKFQGGHASRPP